MKTTGIRPSFCGFISVVSLFKSGYGHDADQATVTGNNKIILLYMVILSQRTTHNIRVVTGSTYDFCASSIRITSR